VTRRRVGVPLRVAALGVSSLLLAVARAAPSAPAGAVRLEPNVAGRGTTLKVDVDPAAADAPDANPHEVAVLFQRGFRFDPRAVARPCTQDEAAQNACPAASRVGTGTADGDYTFGTTSGTFTAGIDVYLASSVHPGDVAGLVVSIHEPRSGFEASASGRVIRLRHGRFGYEDRFDLAGSASPPPGVTISIRRVRLTVGASRRDHFLIRNPKTCSGTYLIRLDARFPDRPDYMRDAHPA
jgi:hypothetical protein